jgi:hypothetical protein
MFVRLLLEVLIAVLGLLFNLTEPSMVVIDTPSPSHYVCPQSSGMRLGRRLARLWPQETKCRWGNVHEVRGPRTCVP